MDALKHDPPVGQIVLVAYVQEGCASVACDAFYQTLPFSSCGNALILTKVAETRMERSVRRVQQMGNKQHGILSTSGGDSAKQSADKIINYDTPLWVGCKDAACNDV